MRPARARLDRLQLAEEAAALEVEPVDKRGVARAEDCELVRRRAL